MRVAGPTVLDRARQGVAHGRRRLEIGLAELEVDHVDAGALELLGPLRDFDGEKRLDLLDPPRERHERPRPTRRRAQFTGTSTMRQPAALASKSSSTSKPNPRVESASNRRATAGAVKALKPH